MKAGVYLVVLTVTRDTIDGRSSKSATFQGTVTVTKGGTRLGLLKHIQAILDKYFVKEYGTQLDFSHPATINFLYVEPN